VRDGEMSSKDKMAGELVMEVGLSDHCPPCHSPHLKEREAESVYKEAPVFRHGHQYSPHFRLSFLLERNGTL